MTKTIGGILIGLATIGVVQNQVFTVEPQSIGGFFAHSNEFEVMVIDNCEYLIWQGSHGEIGATHKGNCKYCEQRHPSNAERND